MSPCPASLYYRQSGSHNLTAAVQYPYMKTKVLTRIEEPRVTFHGAAQSVTGSIHLVEAAGQTILLDCGLTFGNRSDLRQRNRHFPCDPAAIDAVVLSHAHVDHCGNLPNLVKQGFAGPIY